MRKVTVAAALALLACQAIAQSGGTPAVIDPESPEFKQKVEQTKKDLPLNISAESMGSSLSPEERRRLEEVANQLTDKTLQRYQAEGKKFEQQALQMKRRADDIADEALASQREKVLNFLGIDPQKDANLYYFVSFSMPLEVIRSYVLEAMWSGGTVVVRGVPKGRSFKQFLTEDLRQLIYGKGAAANISLDPRLFEAYDVKVVPTIVFTKDRRQLSCGGTQSNTLALPDGQNLSYDACTQLDPNSFWKLSGAVTSDYALRRFIEDGAVEAKPFHNALRKGMAPGVVIPKEQQAFSGEWKDAISPAELMAQRQKVEEMRQKLKADQDAQSAAPQR